MFSEPGATYSARTGDQYTSTISYTYDPAGNRKLKVIDGPTDSYVTYAYAGDMSDRLWAETHYDGSPGAGTPTETINYRWDSNGFLIHKFSASDDELYTASAEGRLATYTKDTVTTTFTYDHAGERLFTTTGTRTIADLVDNANPTGYSQVLKRTDTGGQSFTNIFGDDLLAQQATTGLNHLLSDGHGSTKLLYTSGIDEAYDYDAYGNPVGFDPALTSTNFLYTGEQADLALGDSYYLRARFYMPGPGMFTSLDPYFGDTGEPQSLHKYAYVHGDPVNAWDPSGMVTMTQLATLAIYGAIGGAIIQLLVNYSVGQPLFQRNVLWSAVLGGLLGPLCIFDAVILVASLLGLKFALPLAADVWTNPESTIYQKAAVTVVAGSSITGFRALAGRLNAAGLVRGSRPFPTPLNQRTTIIRKVLGDVGDDVYMHMTTSERSVFGGGVRDRTFFAKVKDVQDKTFFWYKSRYLAKIREVSKTEAKLILIIRGSSKFERVPSHPKYNRSTGV